MIAQKRQKRRDETSEDYDLEFNLKWKSKSGEGWRRAGAWLVAMLTFIAALVAAVKQLIE